MTCSTHNGILISEDETNFECDMRLFQPGASAMNITCIWVYQLNNDPEHISKCTKKWCRVNGVEVMYQSVQSPASVQLKYMDYGHINISSVVCAKFLSIKTCFFI